MCYVFPISHSTSSPLANKPTNYIDVAFSFPPFVSYRNLLQWRMIGLGEKLGGLYIFQNSSHIAVPRNILTLLSKFQSQGWTNEIVEYEIDLVDSTVKSLRSLSNERWERYMESIFKKRILFHLFFGSTFVCV